VQRELERRCGRHRIAGPLENGEEAVALSALGENVPGVLDDAFVKQGIVAKERSAHRTRARFPVAGRSFDVG
jgi:hypothetical protein